MDIAKAFAAIPVLLTALPMIRTGRGWIRMWDFPRLQVASLAAAAGVALYRVERRPADRWLSAALAASFIYQLKKVYRYTPFFPRQVLNSVDGDERGQISLLTCNVFMDNRDPERLLDLARGMTPDVMCFLETDQWWEYKLRPLERDYPFTIKCPLGNTYGMLLYSRLELLDRETRFLVEDGIPSMKARVRLRSGDEVMLYCLHPKPPLPNTPSYGRDAELVLVGIEIEREKMPAIVVGDLNDVAWSYTTTLFQKVSKTLDPRIGRGFYNTFHVRYPLLRYSLDHVFHSEEFTLVDLQRMPDIGSDHFPMWIKLAYTPAAAEVQDPPEAEAEDHEAAQEILEDARAYLNGEK
jgi:endonuclease/exonuclease/phosphatase (EEP) superfamily protein YafD